MKLVVWNCNRALRRDAKWSAVTALEPDVAVVPEAVGPQQRIFDMYASGSSLDPIVALLNRGAIPSPRGRLWSKTQIHSLLRNERYVLDAPANDGVSCHHASALLSQ